jgi:hypothetical protein
MTEGGGAVADDVQVATEPGGESVAPTFPGPAVTRLTGRLRKVWGIGCIAFALQGAGLLVWSWHLWTHFDLTSDFGTFSQAWEQIGTGHLNPRETTFAYYYPHYGYPFWQSHFEIVMWPLGVLHVVSSSTFTLLVVQDLVLAGIGLAGLRFGLELLERQWPTTLRMRTLIGGWLLVVLLVSPWVYWTASFDFHLQPIAILFLVLCARDLWNGRRRAWWWAAAVLACGDVAASYLIGLGIAAVLSGRSTRRHGLYLMGIGLAWVVVVVAIGSGKGSSLAGNYGYLAGVTSGTGVGATFAVVWGIAHHPTAVIDVLRGRRDEIMKFVASTGTVGLFSALGVGVSLAVLVPNALNQSPVFIGAAAAFQNLAAVVFLVVGGVTLFTWLARRGRWGPAAMWLLSALAVVQVVVVAVQWIPRIPTQFLQVDTVTARQLAQAQARIPGSAEVIASQGVIGRFGGRQDLYPYLDSFADGQTIPVTSSTVAFVFVPSQGIEAATPAQTQAAIDHVRNGLGADPIVSTSNVSAFLWHPPPGTTSVRFDP